MNLRTFSHLSGQELAAIRREAGMTQTQLARAAGIGRHAVSYWEQKPSADAWGWAPRQMFEVLAIRVVPHINTSTRAGAPARHGVLPQLDRYIAEAIAREEARLAVKKTAKQARLADRQNVTQDRLRAKEKVAQARRRVPCGAMTRKGQPCRMLSVPGRRRCKLHGGLSTGPRTAEGRERIAEAQRRRWAQWAADGIQTAAVASPRPLDGE